MLYSRSLFVDDLFLYSHVSILTQIPHLSSSPPFLFGNYKFVFYICVLISVYLYVSLALRSRKQHLCQEWVTQGCMGRRITSISTPLALSFAFFFLFFLFRAASAAYGCFQSRSQIGVIATGLRHSHTRSEPRLQPIPQLKAIPDP